MSARGQKFTVIWKTPVYYQDFLDDFSSNPQTGALATVTNEEAINLAIYNLVMTSQGERPGRAQVGSKVMGSMFDLAVPTSLDALRSSILNVIENFEPRATEVNVEVDPSGIPVNAVSVTITYRPVNLPQTVNTTFILTRVR